MRQDQIRRRPSKRDTRDVTEATETVRKPDHAARASRDAGDTLAEIDSALAGE